MKFWLWPGPSVAGKASGGVMLYPAPVTLAAVTETLELPVLVMVTVCVALCPRKTMPKSRLVGLRFKTCVAATPVPVRLTRFGEFGASLVTDTLPEAAPAAVGAN